MKKLPLLLAGLLFMAVSVQAQFYIAPQIGYAFPNSTEPFDLNDISVTSTSYTEDVVFSSLGQGFNGGLAVGYFFNSYLGVEVNGQYLAGTSTSATATVASQVTKLSRETQQFRFITSIVIKAPMEGVKPYAKLGFLVPVGGKSTTNLEEPMLIPGTTEFGTANYILETKGAFSPGLATSFGLDIPVGEKIGIFAEVALQSISIRANTTEMVTATLNGTDILPGIDLYDKQINYLDQLTESSNNKIYNPKYESNQAQDALRTRSQFGSIGFNAGVVIGL